MKKLYLLLIAVAFLATSCCMLNDNGKKTTEFTPREQIIETVNKLFVYTDNLEWDKLQSEVFTPEVLLDMTSMGAEKVETISSQAICDMWNEGLKDLDAVHHQAGNYIITINDNVADVIAYAIASHYKEEFEIKFIGSYNLHLTETETGWRIDGFKYKLKYMK